ncbi:MAG TPA: hypothetical protein VN634_02585 [Candidatus Limnocylindrales bacterium]|nr:hypothetical protein [Candidatus Limnocylindrales bacterium]
MARSTGIAVVVLIGATVATLCDANHVRTGTISYRDPWLFGQAWWVFPEFILTFLAMVAGYILLASRVSRAMPTQRSQSAGSVRPFVESLVLFACLYLISGFASREPVFLCWIFYATFLARWIVSYERAWLLLLALLMGIGGMVGEGLVGATGLAAYRHTDVFHAPLWLAGLYMHGALALRESMRCFVYGSSNGPRS